MALSLDEIDEISRRNPHKGKGDEVELSEQDEALLDEVWAEIAEKKNLKRVKTAQTV